MESIGFGVQNKREDNFQRRDGFLIKKVENTESGMETKITLLIGKMMAMM